MIPENASISEMKRILIALHATSEEVDRKLCALFEQNGVLVRPLGRTAADDSFHYATTFFFQIRVRVEPVWVFGSLSEALKTIPVWVRRLEITQVDDLWRYGLVTLFGIMPFGEQRKRFYADPPKPTPVERYVLKTAERLRLEASREILYSTSWVKSELG